MTVSSDRNERRGWMPEYSITFTVITTVFLGIRLTSRVRGTGGKAGLDDVFIMIGWILWNISNGYALVGKLNLQRSSTELYLTIQAATSMASTGTSGTSHIAYGKVEYG